MDSILPFLEGVESWETLRARMQMLNAVSYGAAEPSRPARRFLTRQETMAQVGVYCGDVLQQAKARDFLTGLDVRVACRAPDGTVIEVAAGEHLHAQIRLRCKLYSEATVDGFTVPHDFAPEAW